MFSWFWSKERKLRKAAEQGNLNNVQRLLDGSTDINTTDDWGNTPLMLAVTNGHLPIAQRLLERGADINRQNKGGSTTLSLAIRRGSDYAQAILAKGPKPDDVSIGGAILTGNAALVPQLLERGFSAAGKATNGWTSLICACRKGLSDLARLLVERGASIEAPAFGDSPLVHAVRALDNGDFEAKDGGGGRQGWLAVIRWLVDSGANRSDAVAIALLGEKQDAELLGLLGASKQALEQSRRGPLPLDGNRHPAFESVATLRWIAGRVASAVNSGEGVTEIRIPDGHGGSQVVTAEELLGGYTKAQKLCVRTLVPRLLESEPEPVEVPSSATSATGHDGNAGQANDLRAILREQARLAREEIARLQAWTASGGKEPPPASTFRPAAIDPELWKSVTIDMAKLNQSIRQHAQELLERKRAQGISDSLTAALGALLESMPTAAGGENDPLASLDQSQLNMLAETSPRILRFLKKPGVAFSAPGMPPQEEALLKSLSQEQLESLYRLQALIHEGEQASEKGDYAAALRCYELCATAAPWHFIAHKSAGSCHFLLGDKARGREYLLRAQKLAPEDQSVRDNLAALNAADQAPPEEKKNPSKDVKALFLQATKEHQQGNHREALRLYSECAELGEPTSQFNLGAYYEDGIGCEKDMQKAMHWYRNAAENGHPDAAGMMGRFFANGECGLAKNMAKAHAYFAFATAIFETDGNPKASETRKWRDNFGRMLDPVQMQESTNFGKALSETNLRRQAGRPARV